MKLVLLGVNGGEPYVLWREVDQHGIELNILVLKRRDRVATKRILSDKLTTS
jgi:putative transposase